MHIRLSAASMTGQPYRLARLFARIVAFAMLVSSCATAVRGIVTGVIVLTLATAMFAAWHEGLKHRTARSRS